MSRTHRRRKDAIVRLYDAAVEPAGRQRHSSNCGYQESTPITLLPVKPQGRAHIAGCQHHDTTAVGEGWRGRAKRFKVRFGVNPSRLQEPNILREASVLQSSSESLHGWTSASVHRPARGYLVLKPCTRVRTIMEKSAGAGGRLLRTRISCNINLDHISQRKFRT
jgi:hypothetical protein